MTIRSVLVMLLAGLFPTAMSAGCGPGYEQSGPSGGGATGSAGSSAQTDEHAGHQHNHEADEDPFATLSPEDQPLARQQQTCPISGEALGSMGTPFKLTLEGETVFLCCQGCEKKARSDVEGTLAKVAELRGEGTETSTQ